MICFENVFDYSLSIASRGGSDSLAHLISFAKAAMLMSSNVALCCTAKNFSPIKVIPRPGPPATASSVSNQQPLDDHQPNDHPPRPPPSLHSFLHPRHLHHRGLRRLFPRPSLLHRSLLLLFLLQTQPHLLIQQSEIELAEQLRCHRAPGQFGRGAHDAFEGEEAR